MTAVTADAVQHPRRPVGATVGDRRGLTAAGAAILALVMAAVGASIDELGGAALGTTFTILFTLGCAVAAYRVHREDLRAAVVIPPLVYAALITVAATIRASNGSGSFLKQQVLELVSALVLEAPAVLWATGVAALVVLLRVVMHRRPGA